MTRVTFLSSIILMFAAVAGIAYIAHVSGGAKPASPAIPRFASLRNGEANMRTGPGTRYPIEWVYKRQGLPVEIIAADEDDIWRRVRDPEGAEGWIHKSELSGKRGMIVTGATRDLLAGKNDKSAIAAHLEPGAVGQLVSCARDMCKVKFGHIKGYLRKTGFWGAYPDEMFD